VAALRVKDAAETRGALEVAVHPRARVCGRLESSDVGGQAQHAYESLTRNRHSTRSETACWGGYECVAPGGGSVATSRSP